MKRKLFWSVWLALGLVGASFAQTTNIAIYSDAADGMLEVRDTLPPVSPWPGIQNTTDWQFSVGEWYGPGLTAAVMPFKLPDFGAVTDPFQSADFGVNYFQKGTAAVTDLDLYALSRIDASPAISGNDWYNGSTFDPSATLIQAGFITPFTPMPTNKPNTFTDGAADATLLNFLNTAYAGGANAGKFVFLRVNYHGDTYATTWDAYNFTSRNAGLVGDWPVINVEINLDSDGDGLPDVWESTYGLDAQDNGSINTNNGAIGDPDNDNLVNSNEYTLGTNPVNPDTDGDGLTDGYEVNTSLTDPLLWDTDGDRLNDGDEVNIHGTNPLLPDTDGDGEDDFLEIFQGTDPTLFASSSAALGLAVVDGIKDSNYGTAVATQTVNTAWDDNLDELDAAYTYIQNGRLFFMLTGNMNTNWNSIEVFIDSSDAVTTSVFTAQGSDNTANMNGLVFDAGFSPDYHLNIRLGDFNGFNFNFDFYDLATKAVSYQLNAFEGLDAGTAYMGPGDATDSIVAMAFTNGNSAGIVSGTDAANQANALAVASGLEFSIALSDLASGYGDIRVMAMVTGSQNGDHDIVCNQILPGVPAPQAALGATTNVNFTAIAGDQFYVVADGSVDSDGDGMPNLWELGNGLDPNDDGTTNPTNGASGDLDSDGLINIDEYTLGTDPQNADTDGDGLTDGDEVHIYGSNPLLVDSDGDGLNDGDEVNIHGSDPTLVDTDGDGEDDFLEVSQGTDPDDDQSSSAILGLIIVDGTLDAAYGAALAVQTVNTAWEDNLDELDAAYLYVKNGKLFFMLTGNMHTNWNAVELFIDSSDAVTANVLTAADNDSATNMNGLVFDTGFSPDYHLNIRRGTWSPQPTDRSMNLAITDLATLEVSSYDAVLGGGVLEGSGTTGTGTVNAVAIAVALNNSNVGGVVSGTAAANQPNALAVSTGLELGIALSDLGNPFGEIRVFAMMTSNSHATVSNQMLPGLAPGQGPLGTASAVDFSAIAGNQYYVVDGPVFPVPVITSMVMGPTTIQLDVVNCLEGYGYKVRESSDLVNAGFADVTGSDFTAASSNETVTVPVDTGANPVMFYQVIAP